MGIFPVEFPTTTADSFESFRVLHYLAFIKEEDALIETCLFTTEDAEGKKGKEDMERIWRTGRIWRIQRV